MALSQQFLLEVVFVGANGAELGGLGNRVVPTENRVEFAEIDGENGVQAKVSGVRPGKGELSR
jgi:hypothetical protein